MGTFENMRSKQGIEQPSLIVYLSVLLMILASKTVFFGILYSQITNIATLIVLFIILYHNQKSFNLSKRKVQQWLLLVGILFAVSLFYISDIARNPNSYLGAIIEAALVFFVGLMASEVMSREEFIICYCRLMFIICAVSLVFFFISLNNRSLMFQLTDIYNDKYIATPYYTFGWMADEGYRSIFGRNAGMWWEPGAFQGFIIIALLGLLNYYSLFKFRTIMLVMFVFTLFTTQSTTGYIAMGISFIAYGNEYIECLFSKGKRKERSTVTKMFMAMGALILTIIIVQIIIKSGNIQNKFDDSNGSYNDRHEDLWGSLKLLMHNPIAGIGLGPTGISIRRTFVNTTTATTLLTLATTFGIPFTIVYCYRFAKGLISLFNLGSIVKIIVVFAMFVLLLMSETLYLLPIYAAFLYEWGGGTPHNNWYHDWYQIQ